jgi:hypothetical protein
VEGAGVAAADWYGAGQSVIFITTAPPKAPAATSNAMCSGFIQVPSYTLSDESAARRVSMG